MLERIVSRENMKAAYEKVVSNKGCTGIDGLEVTDLKPYLQEIWEMIKASILKGDYRPQPVKGVEIDKPKGIKSHVLFLEGASYPVVSCKTAPAKQQYLETNS